MLGQLKPPGQSGNTPEPPTNQIQNCMISGASPPHFNEPKTPTDSGLTPRPERRTTIALIDAKSFYAECLAHCIRWHLDDHADVIVLNSVANWVEKSETLEVGLVILCANGTADAAVAVNIRDICRHERAPPVLVLADHDDSSAVFSAIQSGAKGFIPTNVAYRIVLETIRFVMAGGVFVPATAFMSAHLPPSPTAEPAQPATDTMFTARQMSVIDALRAGKPNKSIAYDLNMCESTVKVHLRHIMKKLKAKNRTQVALLAPHVLR